MTRGVSDEPTPWAVICPKHGKVYLTRDEYYIQLVDAELPWICPKDNRTAEWDDDNYEEHLRESEET